MMKIELSKEETLIIKDLCVGEILKMQMALNNKFLDKAQVEAFCNKLEIIMDKMTDLKYN